MTDSVFPGRGFALMLCWTIGFSAGCQPISELESDPDAGLNGGFESTRNGLPVNWLLYTSNTVTDADFNIVLDREEFREGQRSLRFDIERCEGQRGARAPGFTNEFFDAGRYRGPATYRVSLWLKSTGVVYTLSAGPVDAKTGDMRILSRGDTEIREWTGYVYSVDVPEGQWLRVQFNVCSPGSL